MNVVRSFLVAAALSVSAGVAGAATYTSDGTCSNFDVDPNSDDCFGMAVGNVQQVDPNGDTFDGVVGLFGEDDWVEFQVDESFGGGDSGFFDIVANTYEQVAVLLKSGNEFAAYLFEDGFEGTLEYWTANGNGLSNYSVIGRGETPEIPLPAAGFLLLGGLGGLALMRRRSK